MMYCSARLKNIMLYLPDSSWKLKFYKTKQTFHILFQLLGGFQTRRGIQNCNKSCSNSTASTLCDGLQVTPGRI